MKISINLNVNISLFCLKASGYNIKDMDYIFLKILFNLTQFFYFFFNLNSISNNMRVFMLKYGPQSNEKQITCVSHDTIKI